MHLIGNIFISTYYSIFIIISSCQMQMPLVYLTIGVRLMPWLCSIEDYKNVEGGVGFPFS